MQQLIETSGVKQEVAFGLPSQKRFLLILLSTSISTFFGVVITVLILNQNWEVLIVSLIGISISTFPILLYTLFEFLYTRKKNLERERHIMKNEFEECVRVTEGNLKLLLQNLISLHGGSTEELLNLQSSSKLSQFYTYARERNHYNQLKASLIELMDSDIVDSDIGIHTIEAIRSRFSEYTHVLQALTDALITCMPKNPEEAISMGDFELYRSVIFEENSWLEHETLLMQKYLNVWIENHRKEVAGERIKLEAMLTEQKYALSELIKVTNTMKDQSFAQIQVRS